MATSLLRGKVALITGGGGACGKAISKHLFMQGASVILVGRTLETLQKAQEDILKLREIDGKKDYYGNVYINTSDITNEQSVNKLFEESIDNEQNGKIDLLINNAGAAIGGPMEDISGPDLTRNLQVNVVGPFLCSREAMKRMKKNYIEAGGAGSGAGGRIINIGSISSYSPRPDSIPYTTSKFAITGLTKSLSLDARPYNIAVGIIQPGNFVSSLHKKEIFDEREEDEGFITPDEVAQCVLTMANLPYSTNILELTVLPTKQPLVGRG